MLATAVSHTTFDCYCHDNGITDETVESITDKAFVSIIGTEECRKHWMRDERGHWFKQNHPNVINLEFDDITKDIKYQGHLFKAMRKRQANHLYRFIKKNIGKEFIIHCYAGISRSQAVRSFIVQMYDGYEENDIKDITPNMCKE